MPPALSDFARTLSAETAFTVLAAAKRLKAAGKDVVELEIGDSPFETPTVAKDAGIEAIPAPLTSQKASARQAYRQQLSVTRHPEAPTELRVLVTMEGPEGSTFGYFGVPLDAARAVAR